MDDIPQRPEPGPSPMSSGTSPTLLGRVQRNQAGAWDRLVDLYAPLVHHWCRKSALSPEDTADVFQDVFRALAEHIGGFRRERPGDTFRGWLRTIVGNKIRDHFRRLEGRPRAVGGTDAQLRLAAAAEPAPLEPDEEEDGLVRGQVHQTLRAIECEFEPRTWRAFWQVQMDGQSTDEVGAELGLTPAAVRKAKFRVLRRLREELAGLLE